VTRGLGLSSFDNGKALARTAALTGTPAGRLSARVGSTGWRTQSDQKYGECATNATWGEVVSREWVIPG
jgi:hypothetical protein